MRRSACLSLALVMLTTAACVTHPGNITATYVNPSQYRAMECAGIEGELQRVTAREAELTDRQHNNFVADTALLTVGVVVFWPALLAMPMQKDHRHEIAQVRGETEALERARARCSAAPRMAEAAPQAMPRPVVATIVP
jgi:hypothetical protein